MVRRRFLLASLGLLAGTGCHAGRPARVANTEAPITRADITATRFVEQHNQNAAAVHSLSARPRINPVSGSGRQRFIGRADGFLSLEGEKHFRLEMKAMGRPMADIGSNDDGFWFWVDDDPSKAIYVCDYKDIDSCQLGATLQPDWIMEAMGLRRFTEAEAKTMHSRPGSTPGTILLTQSRKDGRGQLLTKETLVDEETLHIKEHRLFAGTKKELLASAVVSQYKAISMTEPDAASNEGGSGANAPILIPERLQLTWNMDKEKFSLNITMVDMKLNQTFTQARREVLFAEPKIAGTTRQDLALVDPATMPASRVYESKPMPNSGGIRLGTPEPAPVGTEGAVRRQIDPSPLTPDLSSTPAQPAGVVGALVPRGDYYAH